MAHCLARTLTGLVFAAALIVASTGRSVSPSELESIKKGDTFYTQFSLFYEKGRYLTTNYRRGVLLPVNTRVTFLKSHRDSIYVTLPDGEELCIENLPEYSGEDLGGIFRRTFAVSEVDLSRFSDVERKGIAIGQAKAGMSKSAVLTALGYPPKHRTPTLEGDNWRYWSSRYGTFMVEFENDRVSSIRN
jgi:hypothetical protein